MTSPLLGPELSGRAPGAPSPSADDPKPAGFAESPQAAYTSDAELIEASPELARALGLDGDAVSFPEPEFQRPKPERRRPERGDISSMGVAATAESLDALLREGRAEFRNETSVWTPHRPARPEKSEGGQRLVIKSDFEPKGDQPQPSPIWSRACSATTAIRCCSASPARAKPSRWRR